MLDGAGISLTAENLMKKQQRIAAAAPTSLLSFLAINGIVITCHRHFRLDDIVFYH